MLEKRDVLGKGCVRKEGRAREWVCQKKGRVTEGVCQKRGTF